MYCCCINHWTCTARKPWVKSMWQSDSILDGEVVVHDVPRLDDMHHVLLLHQSLDLHSQETLGQKYVALRLHS